MRKQFAQVQRSIMCHNYQTMFGSQQTSRYGYLVVINDRIAVYDTQSEVVCDQNYAVSHRHPFLRLQAEKSHRHGKCNHLLGRCLLRAK